MSEHSEEPGTIIPNGFGRVLLSNVPIILFQSEVALNTKLYLDISRFILGKSIRKFVFLGLWQNSSNTEIGVLYLIILNRSIKVCWIYKWCRLRILYSLNRGLVCSKR